jgi:hypothetical protein
MSGPGGRPGGPGGPQEQQMSLDRVVAEVAAMGFKRGDVMNVVDALQRQGAALDMNIILDRLTRGNY